MSNDPLVEGTSQFLAAPFTAPAEIPPSWSGSVGTGEPRKNNSTGSERDPHKLLVP